MKPSVFISGASRGIGLALAAKYFQEGYRVGICGRDSGKLQEAAEAMPGLLTWVCDMSVKAQIREMVPKVEAALGPLDVLINNAGQYAPGQVHEEADEVYEQMMRTNMDSAYYLTKGLLPGMKARRSGSIVNIASIAGLAAYPGGGSYSISKFAMIGFSRNLRHELQPHGIRVITVMPGAVLTDAWAGFSGPASRLMPPEDIAEAVFSATRLSNRTVVEDLIFRPQEGDL